MLTFNLSTNILCLQGFRKIDCVWYQSNERAGRILECKYNIDVHRQQSIIWNWSNYHQSYSWKNKWFLLTTRVSNIRDKKETLFIKQLVRKSFITAKQPRQEGETRPWSQGPQNGWRKIFAEGCHSIEYSVCERHSNKHAGLFVGVQGEINEKLHQRICSFTSDLWHLDRRIHVYPIQRWTSRVVKSCPQCPVRRGAFRRSNKPLRSDLWQIFGDFVSIFVHGDNI